MLALSWTLLLFVAATRNVVDGFTVATTTISRSSPSRGSSIPLFVEPLTTTIGIAVASAAAGAATQMPRIQALERELDSTKAALELSEKEMVEKITELEEKLFLMDEEFEQQTARFQRKYDQQKKIELEQTMDKFRTDMKYSMEIKLEKEKSKLLMDQAKSMASDGVKQGELSQLKLKQSQMTEANLKLEKALAEAHEEMKRMQGAASQRMKFLGIF